MDGSWRTYEQYTAPLGVGFMVQPGHHYGPGVDGYEYTPWGTYHFADRDGDRRGPDAARPAPGSRRSTRSPWADVYESLETCPDELLLFFHHVPYGHVLHSGIDGHPAHLRHPLRGRRGGRRDAPESGRTSPASSTRRVHARVAERCDEQVRCAAEWRDQVNTYFFRKSGVPDERGSHDLLSGG